MRTWRGRERYAVHLLMAVQEQTLLDIFSYIAIRNNKSACKPKYTVAGHIEDTTDPGHAAGVRMRLPA